MKVLLLSLSLLPVSGCFTTTPTLPSSLLLKRRPTSWHVLSSTTMVYHTSTRPDSSRMLSSTGRSGPSLSCSTSASCLSTPSPSSRLHSLPTWATLRKLLVISRHSMERLLTPRFVHSARAQLLSVPPYVLAAITTVLAGWFSDKAQMRAPFIMGCSAVGALGFMLLIVTKIPGVQYVGLFLAAAGGYPLIPLVVSFGANNCGGSLKKGIATAIIVSVGNAG